MTFASLTYIVFFLITVFLLSLTNTRFIQNRFNRNLNNIRHIILLLASYIFYGWWDWHFCFLMLFITIIAYLAGVFHTRKIIVTLSIGVVLLILGIFKYYNFFVRSFCDLFSISTKSTISIILPVGISFYTFQAISYIIDVYKGNLNCERNFLHVALYISFFPQLVAGPIVKASDFLPQLKEPRNVSIRNIEIGLQIFIFGLFKKIVLADNLSVYVDEIFRYPKVFNSGTLTLAVISYAMQIYFDFSGYSDMAIGSAKCLGYEFSKNFNLPYLSKNISEFWKRWHISLSSWLMEYLYIPLGGNRKGRNRTYVNLMLTMMIGGLWHGANWTFVIWGTLHGIALCIHKVFRSVKKSQNTRQNLVISAICVTMTNIFVCFCWIFFRANDLNTAYVVIGRIIMLSNGVTHIYSWTFIAMLSMIICYFSAVIHSSLKTNKTCNDYKNRSFYDGYYKIMDLNKISSLILFFVMIGLILGLAYTGASPFIYFQF